MDKPQWEEFVLEGKTVARIESDKLSSSIEPMDDGRWAFEVWCHVSSNKIEDGICSTREKAEMAVEHVMFGEMCEDCHDWGYNVVCGWCLENMPHSSCDDTYRESCSCVMGQVREND
jgi:hypothetical protein